MSKKNNSKCEFKYIERTVEGVDLRTICKITTSECQYCDNCNECPFKLGLS